MRTPHRPLTTCPVCSGDLVTTRLGCGSCGTELVGEFGSCSFCALDDSQLDLLRVFLVSRGNLKELEKHLGVSYPTARARFADLLAALGLAEDAPDDGPDDGPEDAVAGEADEASEPGAGPADSRETPAAASAATGSARDQVLAQVAAGTLAPDVAADLLRRLG
ncbi:DUF2089 domain-containing protein [Propioniciclava soli]|uniref:DUF2089 domain-containing protein n=1 Tax=Propioniciclava soli TaxID=2775081 RepID=UPI001E5564B3|nr:DUF2089 family protein [Propioniciclava soli]